MKKIPVETSARHVHLSEKDFQALFGEKAKLHFLRNLSQKGEFAARETVNIQNGKKILRNVRIVGPLRTYTQVELAQTDARLLGINAPITRSGRLTHAAPITLSHKGKRIVRNAAILQRRHIHMNPKEANSLGLRDGARVSVQIAGERSLQFHNVEIKIHERFHATLHLDTDEGNAAAVRAGTRAEILL
jgi:putative phosphotransacetylase